MKKKDKILIIDDNLQNLKVLGNTLKTRGYHVVAIKSGEIALRFLQKNKPDIILLDIMMDSMDGYQVCRQIKATPDICDIPVIYLTAKIMEEDIVKGFETGAVDYITKPFIHAEVLARLENHLKIKKLQNSLNQQNIELKEKNSRLWELNNFRDVVTHKLVHDFKNPLSLIAYKHKDAETMAAVYNMQTITKNILTVKEFEEAGIKLRKESANINDIIEQALLQTNYLIEQKGHILIVKAPASLKVSIDSELMTNTLINLLTNAAKYTLPGGSINVMVNVSNNLLTIDVEDSGIGIPEVYLSKIFDKFFYLNENKKTDGNYSTGLGLAFCKMVVEAHKGKISVTSKVNAGTKYRIEIPTEHKAVDIIEIATNKKEINLLNSNEKMKIKPDFKKLRQLEAYQYSEIVTVIKNIRKSETNKNILFWCDAVENAVKLCNIDLYNKLLND